MRPTGHLTEAAPHEDAELRPYDIIELTKGLYGLKYLWFNDQSESVAALPTLTSSLRQHVLSLLSLCAGGGSVRDGLRGVSRGQYHEWYVLF
jgi:hypothetical protein